MYKKVILLGAFFGAHSGFGLERQNQVACFLDAIRQHNVRKVGQILKDSAPSRIKYYLEQEDVGGVGALSLAIRSGCKTKEQQDQQVAIIRMLVAHGADADRVDNVWRYHTRESNFREIQNALRIRIRRASACNDLHSLCPNPEVEEAAVAT